MITAIICLSILTIVLLYVTINLLRKCESQEEYIEILQANYDSLSQKAKKVNEIINNSELFFERLKILNGLFQTL